jgi:hypothetical protein
VVAAQTQRGDLNVSLAEVAERHHWVHTQVDALYPGLRRFALSASELGIGIAFI